MKTLAQLLKESLIVESAIISFNDKQNAISVLAVGSEKLINFLNSPSKLNKYFKEFGVDKDDKKDTYNLLAELASELHHWMTSPDIYDNIDDDDDMLFNWEGYKEQCDEHISDYAFDIWPKLWKDVVKSDWIW